MTAKTDSTPAGIVVTTGLKAGPTTLDKRLIKITANTANHAEGIVVTTGLKAGSNVIVTREDKDRR